MDLSVKTSNPYKCPETSKMICLLSFCILEGDSKSRLILSPLGGMPKDSCTLILWHRIWDEDLGVENFNAEEYAFSFLHLT
jgi:hypothetical protein